MGNPNRLRAAPRSGGNGSHEQDQAAPVLPQIVTDCNGPDPTDLSSEAGARGLAERQRHYWSVRGVKVNVTVEQIPQSELPSNIRDGAKYRVKSDIMVSSGVKR
jgi:hypothetical protein